MRRHSFEAFRVVGPFVDSTRAKTLLDVRPWCPRRRASAHARGRRRRAAVSRRRCADRRIGTRLGRVSHRLRCDGRAPARGSVDADRWRARGDRRGAARVLQPRRCGLLRRCSQRSPLRLRCLGQAPGPSMRACSAGGASKSATATHTERGASHAPRMRVSRAPSRARRLPSVAAQNTDRAVNPHKQRLARECQPAR